MRKIIESTLVSLDGAFRDPHIWATEYFDAEAEAYALELLSAADAMLMGRQTYEFFAAAFPHRTGEYGDRINSIRKYVFSNTLTKAAWKNSSIVKGDPVTEAARLKQQGGKDLVIYGHGRLSEALLERNLLDELKIWIHPLLMGHAELRLREGKKARLKLVATRTLMTGVIVATYQPAQPTEGA
jgi:dihydrofolate reductase